MLSPDQITLILGALLHDIGKFWQRTQEPLNKEDERIMPNCCPSYDGRYTHQHLLYSGRFVREIFKDRFPLVENIILYHHLPQNAQPEYRLLAKIITLADWLSSGERREREEESGEVEREPLISIFSILALNSNPSSPQYTPLSSLNPDLTNLFPQREKSEALRRDSYSQLWEGFFQEAKFLSQSPLSEVLLTQILYLLQKYTLTIPASAYKDRPDVSLYHHLKSTAAIASCLSQIVREEEANRILEGIRNNDDTQLEDAPCLFLAGDISGIQEFIYSVTSRGALKGLKGRSFYLQLLSEVIAKSIIKKFNLTECNIIYAAGGNFYLLLPNLEKIKSEIKDIKTDFDKKLLEAHRGRLALNLAYKPVRYKDFLGPNFGNIWEEVKMLLSQEKKKRFSSLFENPRMVYEILGPFEEGGERPVCEICGEELDPNEESPCSLCKSFENLAYDLTRAKVMEETFTQPKNFTRRSWDELLKSFGLVVNFLPETSEKDKAYLLNSCNFLSNGASYRGFRFLAQAAPMIGDNVKTLDEIASSADGIKRWAVLRADVDNLGKIFTEGLGTQDKTISRMSMLSEMLSLFFNAQVEKIAREDEFRNKIYVIYSGGDDLFVIGAWSILPDFAKRLYDDFRQFTAGNLTFSAGIYIAPSPKFPVYQAAENAREGLDLAKRGEKNKLTFLGKPVSWEKFSDIKEIKEQIVELLNEEGPNIPRSLLQILYSGWQERERVEKGEIPFTRIWRFLYAFKRLKERHKDFADRINNLERVVMVDKELKPYLDISVRWAELLTREV